MHFNLTIIERMVLESLQYSSKDLNQLTESTALDHDLLMSVFNSLLSKNLIIKNETRYSINKKLNNEIRNELNDEFALMSEINEIISSCLRKALKDKTKNSFKLKKVNMSDREEKIYNGLIYNLESFLSSLNRSDNIAKQKIIFWGEGNYENIKNSILNY